MYGKYIPKSYPEKSHRNPMGYVYGIPEYLFCSEIEVFHPRDLASGGADSIAWVTYYEKIACEALRQRASSNSSRMVMLEGAKDADFICDLHEFVAESLDVFVKVCFPCGDAGAVKKISDVWWGLFTV